MTTNRFPTREQVAQVRSTYTKGMRVELVKMQDVQAPPVGTKGTVQGVDDTGSILIAWDNGSSLNAIYGEDIVRRVSGMRETIKEQILAIRDTGLTNMFDTVTVQRLALDHGYYELVDYIQTDSKAYVTFIMTGSTD